MFHNYHHWLSCGEGEGGTEGHLLTLSVNLECDSNHDRDTVHVIIVQHEENVADVNGVSDTVVCRGRGAVVKRVDCVCPSSHTTSHMYTSEGSEEWA